MYFRCYYSKRNDVNQLCRFLSWTEKMNRCYWYILGLQAHTIIIFRCNQLLYGRVLSGNTVHHFWRSSIYYSFSTQIWSFERDREADTDSRNEENHVCGCNQLLYGTGPFWKYRRSLSKELDLLLILNTSTHFSNTFKICPVLFLPRKWKADKTYHIWNKMQKKIKIRHQSITQMFLGFLSVSSWQGIKKPSTRAKWKVSTLQETNKREIIFYKT